MKNWVILSEKVGASLERRDTKPLNIPEFGEVVFQDLAAWNGIQVGIGKATLGLHPCGGLVRI